MAARIGVLGRSLVIAATVATTVLSGLALAGTAQAATPVAGPAPVAAATLLPQTGSPEYREGFRSGLRDGFQDGQNDARLDCVLRGGHPRVQSFAPGEFDQGYADGYAQGYTKGFDVIRCKKHGRH